MAATASRCGPTRGPDHPPELRDDRAWHDRGQPGLRHPGRRAHRRQLRSCISTAATARARRSRPIRRRSGIVTCKAVRRARTVSMLSRCSSGPAIGATRAIRASPPRPAIRKRSGSEAITISRPAHRVLTPAIPPSRPRGPSSTSTASRGLSARPPISAAMNTARRHNSGCAVQSTLYRAGWHGQTRLTVLPWWTLTVRGLTGKASVPVPPGNERNYGVFRVWLGDSRWRQTFSKSWRPSAVCCRNWGTRYDCQAAGRRQNVQVVHGVGKPSGLCHVSMARPAEPGSTRPASTEQKPDLVGIPVDRPGGRIYNDVQ